MADRVYWHVGLPKTGTTYLQRILWSSVERLRGEGITIPGSRHRDHLWAALDLQEDTNLARRNPGAPGAWERLCREVDDVEGTALLTHEFFCGADVDQVERGLARLAPAEVHVVITARDAAAMLAAGWQEDVKNGDTRELRELAGNEDRAQFGWWVWDLERVLQRWGQVVPHDRIHVLPMPRRGEPADRHWTNFAQVIGFAGDVEMPPTEVNSSIGVVQIEALRKVNARLRGFGAARARGEWIRGYLGENHLARQDGERLRLDQDLLEECRSRSRRAVELVEQRGHPVVGELANLLVPDATPPGRTLGSVTDAEVGDALAALVASMLPDVRDLRKQLDAPEGGRGRDGRLAGVWRRLRP